MAGSLAQTTTATATTRTTSKASGVSQPPDLEVASGPDDADDPKNWSLGYRAWVIFAVSFSTWVVVLYSTNYTASILGLVEYFDAPNETVATLGLTTYLFGLAAGSLVVAPMSELYGWRPVYQPLGWRWNNWLTLILAGASVAAMATVKETYTPVILQRKAAKKRKEEDDERWWSCYDHKISTTQLLKTNLSRSFVLSLSEPILWFFNIWISIIYCILYLCFVAYRIVFQQYRGWGPGAGVPAFMGVGIGTVIAIVLEPLWRHMVNSHAKDPATGRAPPEASAAVMSIGAILTPIGQLVFSWTCLPVTIHWAVPIASGIPFGMGNTLSFIYGSHYLAGSYGIYAALALAGNAVMRAFFGDILPLVGPSMYAAMTPRWAGTLLGLLEVCLVPIPFVFSRYRKKIRAKSRVSRQVMEDQARSERQRTGIKGPRPWSSRD